MLHHIWLGLLFERSSSFDRYLLLHITPPYALHTHTFPPLPIPTRMSSATQSINTRGGRSYAATAAPAAPSVIATSPGPVVFCCPPILDLVLTSISVSPPIHQLMDRSINRSTDARPTRSTGPNTTSRQLPHPHRHDKHGALCTYLGDDLVAAVGARFLDAVCQLRAPPARVRAESLWFWFGLQGFCRSIMSRRRRPIR
jgi:hypothetical protein